MELVALLSTSIVNKEEVAGSEMSDEYNKINANVHFDIRFKPNRIRFSVKIQEYQVLKSSGGALVENRMVYVKDCFPINPNSDHKKSYSVW